MMKTLGRLIGFAVLAACAQNAFAAPGVLAKTVVLGAETKDEQPGGAIASATSGTTASAFASRSLATVQADSTGFSGQFSAPIQMTAQAESGYTAFGLAANAPVTLTWRWTGSYATFPDDAQLSIGGSVGVFYPGTIATVTFNGLSFVDNAPGAGDFAGQGFGTLFCGGAGNGVPSCSSTWNGRGTRTTTLDMIASTGTQGTFGQSIAASVGGAATTLSFSIQLVGATVPNAGFLTGPAYLQLDNGQQILISAVPEADTWAMFAAGLAVICAIGARRRAESSRRG